METRLGETSTHSRFLMDVGVVYPEKLLWFANTSELDLLCREKNYKRAAPKPFTLISYVVVCKFMLALHLLHKSEVFQRNLFRL